jgi:hypothetical protein
MQPRGEEIYRVLTNFVKAGRAKEADGSRRRGFALVVQSSAPLAAEIRELRSGCAMIDIGSSIYTLAYSDILGIDPASAGEGGLRVTVKAGCFASHAAARLRRAAPRSWSGTGNQQRPLARPTTRTDQAPLVDMPSDGYQRKSGAAESDSAGTESARHEIVVNDASRSSR